MGFGSGSKEIVETTESQNSDRSHSFGMWIAYESIVTKVMWFTKSSGETTAVEANVVKPIAIVSTV